MKDTTIIHDTPVISQMYRLQPRKLIQVTKLEIQHFKNHSRGLPQCSTSIIPATQETEITRIKVQGWSGQKVSETQSQSISQDQWLTPMVTAKWEARSRTAI
jgi:hypothetical protein